MQIESDIGIGIGSWVTRSTRSIEVVGAALRARQRWVAIG